MTLLFDFFCDAYRAPLTIDGIRDLSVDDQLNILDPAKIDSVEHRKCLTQELWDKLPDLRSSAHKRIRFKALLSWYYKDHLFLCSVPAPKWDRRQLPLSLFVYLMDQLRRVPAADDDKDREALRKEKGSSLASTLRFIDCTHRYCREEGFDGEQLSAFWNEVTNHGQKTGGFGLKFVKKICGRYKLKFGKFANIKKKIGPWYMNGIERVQNGNEHENEGDDYNHSKKKEKEKEEETVNVCV